MIKVIIADDEEKICQLIYKLVNWEELGMQVCAVVHNGIEALESIEKIKPEVVITDIRMPGCDGLEMIKRAKELSSDSTFIIISGYRHFQYAQSAIRYGVRDYLLKPIKKDELFESLDRIRKEHTERLDWLRGEGEFKLTVKNSVDKLRAAFFTEILFKNNKTMKELEKINNEYHYGFKEGYFQIALIKIDGLDNTKNNVSYIQEKINRVIKKFLESECFDYENVFEGNYCYIILNYDKESKKTIRLSLKKVIDELCLQKNVLESLNLTLGIGLLEDEVINLNHSLKTAMWAIEQRIVIGVNRLIEGEDRSLNDIADSEVFHEFNKMMLDGLESLDENQVRQAFQFLEQALEQKDGLTGHEVIQMSKEAINLYLFTMKKNKFHVAGGESFFEDCSEQINHLESYKKILSYVTEMVITSFKQALSDKASEDTKPIRDAKKYIKENYKEPVSLELVSDYVGFNSAYFSTLFKKETGVTFLEYLTDVRMKKAKELLKETNLNIAAICEEVGYSDVKYFTKSFAKYTGLKPSGYRKIYS